MARASRGLAPLATLRRTPRPTLGECPRMTENHRRLLLLGGIVDTFSSNFGLRSSLPASHSRKSSAKSWLPTWVSRLLHRSWVSSRNCAVSDRPGENLNAWVQTRSGGRRTPECGRPQPLVSPRPEQFDSGARLKLSARGKPTAVEDVFRSNPETPASSENLLRELNDLAVEAATLAEALRETGQWMEAPDK